MNKKKIKNICVYTCIMGNYDKLKELSFKEEGIDYICFTNNKTLISKTWKVIYVDNDGLSDHLLSRNIKIIGHPYLFKNYDFTVYMDGSMQIVKSIWKFMDKYNILDYTFSGFVHSYRNCIYEEAEACIELRKDNVEVINEQMRRYRKENYPKNNGLIEATILFRKINDSKVKETMKLWFNELLNGSKRDQLSFNYVLNKTGLIWNKINLKVFDNEYFHYTPHISKNNLEYYNTMYTVYFDYGKGLDYKNSTTKIYKYCDNYFIGDFNIPKDAKGIVFIPVENNYCIFSDIKFYSNNKELKFNVLSPYTDLGDKKLLLDTKPGIEVCFNNEDDNVSVEINMETIDPKVIIDYFESEKSKYNLEKEKILNHNELIKNENNKLREENKILKDKNEMLIEELNKIYNSKT